MAFDYKWNAPTKNYILKNNLVSKRTIWLTQWNKSEISTRENLRIATAWLRSKDIEMFLSLDRCVDANAWNYWTWSVHAGVSWNQCELHAVAAPHCISTREIKMWFVNKVWEFGGIKHKGLLVLCVARDFSLGNRMQQIQRVTE